MRGGEHQHDEDFLGSYEGDGEKYKAHQPKLVSAELRKKIITAARVTIWTWLGVVGGGVAGAAVGGPVGTVGGMVTGGIGGFALGRALVNSEKKPKS